MEYNSFHQVLWVFILYPFYHLSISNWWNPVPTQMRSRSVKNFSLQKFS